MVGVILLAPLAGCGPTSSDPQVTGQVTVAGTPLDSATLMFFPTSGRSSAVALESDGTYRLRLPPGEYRVTVQQGATIPEGYEEGDPLPPPAVEVPQKYSRRSTTTLVATVAPDQTEPIDFTLE